MAYDSGARRTDGTGPAVHVFDYLEEARWAAMEDPCGDVRHGDVVLVPSIAVAAVKLDGRTYAVTPNSGDIGESARFLRLSPDDVERYRVMYRDTFEMAGRAMRALPEFGHPAEVGRDLAGWERTTVLIDHLECGDYWLTGGTWLEVRDHEVVLHAHVARTRVETVVRIGSDECRRLVHWIDVAATAPEPYVPVWRPLPLTVFAGAYDD